MDFSLLNLSDVLAVPFITPDLSLDISSNGAANVKRDLEILAEIPLRYGNLKFPPTHPNVTRQVALRRLARKKVTRCPTL